MKTLLLACLLVVLESWGQSRRPARPPISPKPQATATASDFRIVDGKVYNTQLSTNWTVLPKGPMLRVNSVTTNGVIVQEYNRNFVTTSPRNSPIQEQLGLGRAPEGFWQEILGEEYVIKNLPDEKTVTTGQILGRRTRVMRVGTVTIESKRLGLYDCGVSAK